MKTSTAVDGGWILVPKLSLLGSVTWRASAGTVKCCLEHEC
jgi:hypothetical protein